MNLKHYTYFTNNDFQDYEFYSEGPKGKIKKVVRFSKIEVDPIVYNLGFGDEKLETGEINDSVITNNEDRDTVLATVANTIIDFSNYHNNPYIYAKGSTLTRTRLYQIGISKLWEEINKDFDLYGLKEENWQEFKKNVNYKAFLVKRK